jgi:hypothetical protein
MNTIKDRLRAVIERNTDERGRFAELEKMTEISANSWKSFWHGRQRPTCDMIEAVCSHWPQHAFWLTTGLTDAKNGHVNDLGKADFPERPRAKRNSAERYWELTSRMLSWRNHQISKDVKDDEHTSSIEHSESIQLLELEIARNAEQQALAGIEDAELVSELLKLKTPFINQTDN